MSIQQDLIHSLLQSDDEGTPKQRVSFIPTTSASIHTRDSASLKPSLRARSLRTGQPRPLLLVSPSPDRGGESSSLNVYHGRDRKSKIATPSRTTEGYRGASGSRAPGTAVEALVDALSTSSWSSSSDCGSDEEGDKGQKNCTVSSTRSSAASQADISYTRQTLSLELANITQFYRKAMGTIVAEFEARQRITLMEIMEVTELVSLFATRAVYGELSSVVRTRQ